MESPYPSTTVKSDRSLFRRLLDRRVPQIAGAYLGVGLGVLQLVQWLVNRFSLSPHWEEFAVISLLLFLPAVGLLAYNHGAPGSNPAPRLEKVGIPVNVALALLVLFLAFKDKELGRTTRTVVLEDDTGRSVERIVAKDAFRKRIGIFLFDNYSGDAERDWLEMAVPASVALDMSQDMFVSPQPPSEFAEDVRRAGFNEGMDLPRSLKRRLSEERNLSHFLSGSVLATDSAYVVSTELFDTEKGRVIADRSFEKESLFDLIDAISVQVRRDLGLSEGHIENTPDLPVADLLTSSEEALRAFSEALTARAFTLDHETATERFESAVAADPTFA